MTEKKSITNDGKKKEKSGIGKRNLGRGEGEGKESNMSPWLGEGGLCNFFFDNTQNCEKYLNIVV